MTLSVCVFVAIALLHCVLHSVLHAQAASLCGSDAHALPENAGLTDCYGISCC